MLDHCPDGASKILLALAVMMFAGFAVTRLTKRLRLPNVTGYILAGVLIGPYVCGLVPAGLAEQMDFVTDIALAFIAFSVGQYFRLETLRKTGYRVVIITLFEALIAFAAVTLVMAGPFHLSLPFSLLLGAIASATAPASTIMTIRQYRAKGPFVDTILEVVALDDAVALIAFSICAAAIGAGDGQGGAFSLLAPLLWNLVALTAGGLGGLLLHRMVDFGRSSEHRLVLVAAVLFTITGLCSLVGVSPLLSCMALGTAYINVGGQYETFRQAAEATPPVLLLFFVLSGVGLNVPMLATAGVIGVVYFFTRIAGKYAGAWLGCLVSRASRETRRFLGLALVPQAGVSIGLAALARRLLPGSEGGALISTIILSSGVLYEMVGPACAKASLYLSHTLTRTKAQTDAAPAAQGQEKIQTQRAHARRKFPKAG